MKPTIRLQIELWMQAASPDFLNNISCFRKYDMLMALTAVNVETPLDKNVIKRNVK